MGDRQFPDPLFDDAFAAKYGLPPGTQITGPPISGTLLSKTPDGLQGPLLSYKGPWPPPKENQKGVAEVQPRPAAPSPAPPEIIPDNEKALAIGLSPDVCRAPEKPCPFPVWGTANNDYNYSPNVLANGEAIKRFDSKFTITYGDEPGTGLGVKSGTVGDVVEPATSSPIVKVNGIPIQRHADRCTLNNGNTEGEYCYVNSTETKEAPDAADNQDRSTIGQAKEELGHFWAGMKATSDEASLIDGAVNKISDYYNGKASLLEDVQGVYESLPTRPQIWQSTQDIGSGLYNVGENVINDPIGSAKAAGGFVADGVKGAVNSVEKGYNTHGVSGALGAGTGVLASVLSPGKKLKMLKEAGEGLEEAGKIGKIAREAEHVEDAKKVENAGEKVDGGGGGRVTGHLNVPCFDLPRGVNRDEFRRQLKEQQATINNMTADDMAYAHTVLDHAKKAWGNRKGPFTNLLRDSKAQDAARSQYEDSLREAGYSASEIQKTMSSLNATHYLDIYAGGNPSSVGIGGGAENQRIGPMWAQRGRANLMKQEANRLRTNGQANKLMKVELKICGE